jgi:hypothetical protein
MPLLLLKVAALAVAAGAAGTAGQAALVSGGQSQQAVVRVYIVRSGDTLGKIAGEFCGNPAKYPSLARASGIPNPNVISVGQRIILACGRSGGGRASVRTASISGSNYAAGSAAVPGTSMVYSYAGLERLWIAAGGSGGTAYHAACIAEHESSGRTWVVSPTNDWGLWQIHAGGYPMLNAYANAQRAVAMSGNGRNWGQWTTRGYC